ncbi:MAG: C40 family peptidase [Oscillospiraceae bacterium]|jgi:hypothetical protein|nr:C40 family peptidase [Oscillospiraceae bacterium]
MKAIVNSPICPLMSQPRHDCELADEALFGMVVDVLERTTPDYWRIRTHYRYEGYAPVTSLVIGDQAADDWAALPKKVVLHKNTCDVMAGPKVQSFPLTTLPMGAVVAATEEPETDPETGKPTGWQRISLPDGAQGYVRSSWLDTYYDKPIDLPERELRQRLVDTAKLFARTHYRWGGKSPLGVDCSGLVSMSYLLNGIIIYRDASIKEGFPVHPIDLKDIKPADLLFFPGHVAMYIGDSRYIHSTGKAGSDGVTINSLDPAAPDYREDLPKSITGVGSYF